MDAQNFFQAGVAAIRERKDKAEGRRLLIQSLKLDPQNEMAWLWLARVTDDPQKRLQCLDKALSLNPANEQAREFKRRLTSDPRRTTNSVAAVLLDRREKRATAELKQASQETEAAAPQPIIPPAQRTLTPKQQAQIDAYLKRGMTLLGKDDIEGAIEQWVYALQIQPDHEMAMRNAVQHLARLGHYDDAKELIWRAIDGGTSVPSIYMTAIDLAKREDSHEQVEQLRERIVRLPNATDQVIIAVVDGYRRDNRHDKAEQLLNEGIQAHPGSQKLLTKMGDLKEERGRHREAMLYYERAAQLGVKTKEGKEADQRLRDFVPVLTDQERGSMALAWREAAGFGLFYLLLGWQDAGLNLVNMGMQRWAGVFLSLVGGYLVITATSSPQQQPLAGWLGGRVPDVKEKRDFSWTGEEVKGGVLHDATQLPILPLAARLIFGVIGGAILLLALWMVFNTALHLLANPVPPDLTPLLEQAQ